MSRPGAPAPAAATEPGLDVDGRPAVRWFARAAAPPAAVEPLVRALGVPPLVASLLWSRGITGGDVSALLSPPLEPSPIPALDEAAGRLYRALERGERILVHGDYDADGITGTAILTLGLRALGGKVEPFLPNRLTHGYGVHPDLVDEHAARADLFVTVDCGIANVNEVARLRANGVDVIVTDHHTPGEVLPDALVVHPRHAPDTRPGAPELTGAGVAYHLLWRLHDRIEIEAPVNLVDLAAIGTIADVAPLMGPNRALVREGLERLADSAWPGVRALVAQARLRDGITARDVAFGLAPRLNASGRLGEPEVGLELLVTPSERRARELAVYLSARNDERKRIQDGMFEEALGHLDPAAPAVIIGDDGWHPGIMGIVASKLLERTFKPVFIMAKGQGSVRSTPGISAIRALRAAQEELERFGGHVAAAGFKIRPERVGAFRDAVYEFVASHPTPVPEIVTDALLGPDQVEEDLWRALCGLEPFGEGHPAPMFSLCDTLDAARAVGRDARHLQLRLRGVKGVAWQQGGLAARLRPGGHVQTAAALRENVWKDVRSLEFVAENVRPMEPLRLLPVAGPASGEGDGDHGGDGDEAAGIPEVHRGRPSDAAGVHYLRALPLAAEPLDAGRALSERLSTGVPIWFDLDAAAQEAIRDAARRYPTVHDVRRAFVAVRAGRRPQLSEGAAELARRILEELALLDARGRARTGQRRDPYESETLVAGLLQRYRLETFLNAYRQLDDRGFARTVAALYGPSPVRPAVAEEERFVAS